MRRHGKLFEKIVDRDNLHIALKNACKPNGRTSPSKRKAVEAAKADPEMWLDKIETILHQGNKTSTYNCYPLFDPKLRFIYALPFYPDRIVHHALMVVLEPIWDSMMMHTSYACRKFKGQHQAGNLCGEYTRRYRYAAQFDVAQFYVSINHEIMKQVIRRKIKDQKVLIILDEIIDSISTRDRNLEELYAMKREGIYHKDIDREILKLETSKARDNSAPAGLPIGSYTSQWLGNLYLNELDEFLKQELGCKAVLRYCDDFIVFSNDKKFLHDVRVKVTAFMWEKLHLILSKADVFPTSQGVDFCGYRYFPQGYVLLRKRTAKRQRRQLKEIRDGFRSGKMSQETARAKIASMDGWMQWAQCYNWKKNAGFFDIKKEILDAG